MSLLKNDSFDENFRSTKSLCKSDSSDDKGGESLSLKSSSVHSLSSLSYRDEQSEYRDHARAGYEKMEQYFIQNQLTDVTLIAGDKNINAHRIVLCAASDYFAAMFMADLVEAKQKQIELHEIDGDILWKLIYYCYSGKIELHQDTVEPMLATASFLQLPNVTDTCCQFLKRQLNPSNCIGIGLFADQHNCIDLKEAAYNYTANYFMEVTQNQEFLNLPERKVCELLMSDDLNVPAEDCIFKALMKWVEFDKISRSKNIGTLLGLVRLPLLEPSFIADNVETKEIIRKNPACQALLMEAMKYHLLPERRPLLQNSRTHPRKSTVGVLYAIGGSDPNKGVVLIDEYNVRENSWKTIGSMSNRRLQFGSAVINDKLYVVGGRDGLKTLNTAECLDLKTMIWTSLPSMITSRHGLGVAVLEGPLYAVGGHDGWSYLNTVERWDPDARQWNAVAPMSLARSTAGVAVLNNKLYVIGGRDSSSCLKSIEKYDPHTNKWVMCSSMIKRRGAVGVGVLNGYLYVVGGLDSPASIPLSSRFECVERYDPKADSWSIIANMSVGRDSVGVGILGDSLFAIGGYDGQDYLRLVEMYDPTNNKWKQVCPLKTGRAGACIVAVKKLNKNE